MTTGTEDFSFLSDHAGEHFYEPSCDIQTIASRGLDAGVVERISTANRDPEWLRQLRLDGLGGFNRLGMPSHWAPEELAELDFDSLSYFVDAGRGRAIYHFSELVEADFQSCANEGSGL